MQSYQGIMVMVHLGLLWFKMRNKQYSLYINIMAEPLTGVGTSVGAGVGARVGAGVGAFKQDHSSISKNT